MAAQVLDFGVRRGRWPASHVCGACGSTRDACRGYPNDVWYCAPCVPPELAAIAVVPPSTQADLLSGFAPA